MTKDRFISRVAGHEFVRALFDRMPDMVFSIKDRRGRYMHMAEEGIRRFGLSQPLDVVGKTVFDLFPEPMARRYDEQDQQLFSTGDAITDNLDLTIYRGGDAGWCLTTKEPLRDVEGGIIGLACISKDLSEATSAELVDSRLARLVDGLQERPRMPLTVESMATAADLSVPQLNRRMKKIFHLTAGQYIIKVRIDHAARLLSDSDVPLAEIALELGFSDQSALSRQFKQVTGMTPRQYRQLR